MKKILVSISLMAVSTLALAIAPGAPEIDGSMALQGVALAGGLMILLKRKG